MMNNYLNALIDLSVPAIRPTEDIARSRQFAQLLDDMPAEIARELLPIARARHTRAADASLNRITPDCSFWACVLEAARARA